jgi:hypothetical protein
MHLDESGEVYASIITFVAFVVVLCAVGVAAARRR